MGTHRREIIAAGFTVDSVAIARENEPAVSVQRIDFLYNLLGVFGRSISVSSLTLVRPEIRIHRLADDAWNTGHLLRPVPPDTIRPAVRTERLGQAAGDPGRRCCAGRFSRMREADDTLTERRHDFTARNINALLVARIAPEEKYVNIQRVERPRHRPER